MATRSDVQARLAELARRAPGARPVVSVYLNTRWSSTVIATRAAEHLARLDEQEDATAVDRMLHAAAKVGRAVAGVNPIRNFERPGAMCQQCGALQPPVAGACRFCGAATQPTELGEAMTGRVGALLRYVA